MAKTSYIVEQMEYMPECPGALEDLSYIRLLGAASGSQMTLIIPYYTRLSTHRSHGASDGIMCHYEIPRHKQRIKFHWAIPCGRRPYPIDVGQRG